MGLGGCLSDDGWIGWCGGILGEPNEYQYHLEYKPVDRSNDYWTVGIRDGRSILRIQFPYQIRLYQP